MFGNLILLKLLHYRRQGSRNKLKTVPRQSSVSKLIEKENEEYLQKCRVCLKDGSVPIFGNMVSEDISKDLRTFADIEIDPDDNYPQFLCNACKSLLQGAIVLRKTAKHSELTLAQPPSDNDHDTDGQFTTESNLDEKEVQKSDDNGYFCKKCDKSFFAFEDYSDHISVYHENARGLCPICNKSYKERYLKRHLAVHNKTQFICDICGKHSIFKGEFTRHRLTHFYSLPYKCSLCPYRGRFPESLKMHMRSHTGEKPYQCTQCPSRFVNKSNLNKHSLTHKDSFDFKCESCARGFYTKRSYDLHFKVDHGGIKEHVCNICKKAFGYRKQMMKHQLKVHKREKLRSGRLPLYLQVDLQKVQANNS